MTIVSLVGALAFASSLGTFLVAMVVLTAILVLATLSGLATAKIWTPRALSIYTNVWSATAWIILVVRLSLNYDFVVDNVSLTAMLSHMTSDISLMIFTIGIA